MNKIRLLPFLGSILVFCLLLDSCVLISTKVKSFEESEIPEEAREQELQ